MAQMFILSHMMQLRIKLTTLWHAIGKLGVTSLGKGFYKFCFSILDDVGRVRFMLSWNLNPRVLKLLLWSRDFIPNNVNHTSAQVWVRIHGLPTEYGTPKIIFAIASNLCTPICIDSISNRSPFDKVFGHFVRVLVDTYFSMSLEIICLWKE